MRILSIFLHSAEFIIENCQFALFNSHSFILALFSSLKVQGKTVILRGMTAFEWCNMTVLLIQKYTKICHFEFKANRILLHQL